jgi:hypothetical protein
LAYTNTKYVECEIKFIMLHQLERLKSAITFIRFRIQNEALRFVLHSHLLSTNFFEA